MKKWSRYNILVNENEESKLIFNSASGAMAHIDNNIYDQLSSVESFEVNKIENIDVDEIVALENHGYICDYYIDEVLKLNYLRDKKKYNKKNLVITIAPTMECNMKCPYCFEDKTGKKMSSDVEHQTIEYIKEKIKKERFENLNITWYGGEPLLELELIKRVSEELIEFCKSNSIRYRAGIITNGLLFNKENADILKDCLVDGVQITIDGPKLVHNGRRVSKEGLDSFSIITENIEDNKNNFGISIRVNVDRKNISALHELIDYFEDEMNWGRIVNYHFAPIENSTDFCTYNKKDCYSNKEFSDVEIELIKYRLNKNPKTIINRPTPTAVGCEHVFPNVFVIGPEGYMYRCWNNIGNYDKNVGHITNGEVLNAENLAWLSYTVPDKCEECVKRPVCQGGCPYVRMEAQKDECHHKSFSVLPLLNLISDQSKNLNEI